MKISNYKISLLGVLFSIVMMSTVVFVGAISYIIITGSNTVFDMVSAPGELNVAALQHELDTLVEFTNYSLAAIVLMLLGMAMMNVWWTRLHLVRPLNAMTSSMSRLADGQLETDVPYQDWKSEIGDMARAVLVFKENAIRANKLQQEKGNGGRNQQTGTQGGPDEAGRRFPRQRGHRCRDGLQRRITIERVRRQPVRGRQPKCGTRHDGGRRRRTGRNQC